MNRGLLPKDYYALAEQIAGGLGPDARDPQGIHKVLRDEFIDNEFVLPPDKPLTLASYRADSWPEAFIEPVAVGDPLPEMPLFLVPDIYLQMPLEGAHQSAWEAVPSYWRDVVEGRIIHRPAAPH